MLISSGKFQQEFPLVAPMGDVVAIHIPEGSAG
jgi:hypothetical protein